MKLYKIQENYVEYR